MRQRTLLTKTNCSSVASAGAVLDAFARQRHDQSSAVTSESCMTIRVTEFLRQMFKAILELFDSMIHGLAPGS